MNLESYSFLSPKRISIMSFLFIVFVSGTLQCTTFHPDKPVFEKKGLAIGGFDPVAYHAKNTAVPGNENFRLPYKGSIWQFSSQANLSKFQKEPDKYEPAYGGYCAYGMAQGDVIKSDPNAWSVKDGRLYLNYNMATKEKFDKNSEQMIRKADGHWKNLMQIKNP